MNYLKTITKTTTEVYYKVVDEHGSGSEKLLDTDQLIEFLEERELGVCDKCSAIESTYSLVWLTSGDFKPHQDEYVSKSMYKLYDCLCEECYKELIKTLEVLA